MAAIAIIEKEDDATEITTILPEETTDVNILAATAVEVETATFEEETTNTLGEETTIEAETVTSFEKFTPYTIEEEEKTSTVEVEATTIAFVPARIQPAIKHDSAVKSFEAPRYIPLEANSIGGSIPPIEKKDDVIDAPELNPSCCQRDAPELFVPKQFLTCKKVAKLYIPIEIGKLNGIKIEEFLEILQESNPSIMLLKVLKLVEKCGMF